MGKIRSNIVGNAIDGFKGCNLMTECKYSGAHLAKLFVTSLFNTVEEHRQRRVEGGGGVGFQESLTALPQ